MIPLNEIYFHFSFLPGLDVGERGILEILGGKLVSSYRQMKCVRCGDVNDEYSVV